MGQVWSKADCDGGNQTGNQGGRGSVIAVTGQNPGPDGEWGTADDLNAPLSQAPVQATLDNAPDANDEDPLDRVRGFYSFHDGGSIFAYADGSTHFIETEIAPTTYRALSTRAGGEVIGEL